MDRSLPPGGSPRTSDDVPRSLPRVVATAVLGLVVVASALAGPWVAEGRGPGVAADRDLGAPRPPPPDKLDDRELAELVERLPTPDVDLGGLWTVVLVVVTVLLGLVVMQVVRARLRGGPTPDVAEGRPGEALVPLVDVAPPVVALRGAVDDAVVRLEAAPAPADAIVAAWVALEQAAEDWGVRRDPADTPTEFTVAVLDRAHADPGATRTLLALYLRARFSDEALGADDVAAARSALDVVAQSLAARRHEDDR